MRCALGVIVFLAAGVLAVGGAEEPDEAGVDQGLIRDYSSFRLSQKSLVPKGARSCAKGGCHGADLSGRDEGTFGKEWSIWYEKTEARHRKAYELLESERSKNMAALLSAFDQLESNPTERKDCLSCHAMDVPDSPEHTTQFKITEGVSCEACHGRATHWIESHSNNGWKSKTAEQKASLGMYDTRDLIRRAELCMSCHVGDDDRNVTHRMMAAGHPELPFELATDLIGVPHHWRNGRSFLNPKKNEGPAFHARVWAVGQAMLLRESARRAMRWAESSEGVELALFECYACHHELGFSTPAAVRHQDRK
ncbi:MAG: multiheme c-type cytochrome, partial [Planctomycetota bacterium]|nr:multiheme c-type cytochrome [Planctomycetota bacterium]